MDTDKEKKIRKTFKAKELEEPQHKRRFQTQALWMGNDKCIVWLDKRLYIIKE